MKFVHFTGPTGAIIPINAEDVAELRPATAYEAPTAKTIIVLTNGASQAVREPIDQVEEKLK